MGLPRLSISSIWRRPPESHALGRAGAVLSHDTSKELRPDEIPLIRNARLLQFTAAGVDWVPTRDLPPELPVAAMGLNLPLCNVCRCTAPNPDRQQYLAAWYGDHLACARHASEELLSP